MLASSIFIQHAERMAFTRSSFHAHFKSLQPSNSVKQLAVFPQFMSCCSIVEPLHAYDEKRRMKGMHEVANQRVDLTSAVEIGDAMKS